MKRDKTIDVLKGLGIISIVLGHACNLDNFYSIPMKLTHDFVYTYHIMIFVFVSGYLFHESSVKKYIVKRIHSLYIPTVITALVSLAIYPLWIKLSIVEVKDKGFFIKDIIKTITFRPSGIFVGALWFVPFIFLVGLAGNIIYKMLKNKTKLLLVVVLVLGVLGLCSCNIYGKYFNIIINLLDGYSVSRVLIAIPIFFMGMYVKNKNLLKRINPFIWPFAGIVILLFNYITGKKVDIAAYEIYGGYLFYIITIIGIIFIVSFGNFVALNKTTGDIVSYIGKLSLSIMAGHFMVFKLIDGIAGQVVKVGSDRLQLFPYSFPQLWWLYIILGITIPIVVSIIIEKIRLKIIKNNI